MPGPIRGPPGTPQAWRQRLPKSAGLLASILWPNTYFPPSLPLILIHLLLATAVSAVARSRYIRTKGREGGMGEGEIRVLFLRPPDVKLHSILLSNDLHWRRNSVTRHRPGMVPRGHPRVTPGVPRGYPGGTPGVPGVYPGGSLTTLTIPI